MAKSAEWRPMSDLNTTPLIDVMLVLLIMIILTVPQPTHKVGVNLPTAIGLPGPDLTRNRITIDGHGVIAWNGQAVDRIGLRRTLAASMGLPVEPALDFVPAADARYEVVDAVLADIKKAGVTKLGLPGNQAYAAF
ncbi:MAG: biopolymer transporter ExbD [Sphingobium sp.]|nr:biopolymer transporter ExbD [Sphingobium sp.]